MVERVLIVCVGNICRSPMAEIMLRDQLAKDRKVVVESAGLAAMVGSPIDPLAESVLVEHGLTGKSHLARQIEGSLVQSAGIIFTMDKRQRAALLALAPWAHSKVVLLGKWQGDVEIPDPYCKQRLVFEHTYQLIDSAIGRWRNLI